MAKESPASPGLETSSRKQWSYAEKCHSTYLHTPGSELKGLSLQNFKPAHRKTSRSANLASLTVKERRAFSSLITYFKGPKQNEKGNWCLLFF